MKLLIITQKVDRTDPILGFFHRWIAEFAMHCESVVVIGQFVGQHELPKNVTVLSLRKEKGYSTFRQILRFWKLVVLHQSSYNHVFVHMTPVWILLGAHLWIVLRKPMYLWYEIKRGSAKLSIALLFVRKVFAASAHGLPAVSKKQVTVGHGIDIDLFTPDATKRERRHLVAVGRVTGIKHYEVLFRALSRLPDCRLTVAGGTVTEADVSVEKGLQSLMHRLGIADRVEMGWVSPENVPQLLQRADCMMHASQGGLDKAVLQAMACGCPVVSTSEAAHSVLPPACRATKESLAENVQNILALSDAERGSLCTDLRTVVQDNHSLEKCIARLVSAMQ